MKLAILSATLGAACAFTQPAKMSATSARSMSDEAAAPAVEEVEEPKPTPINGWVADASKPCYGLPGAVAPLGFFDPLGFTKDRELVGVKRIREGKVIFFNLFSSSAVPSNIRSIDSLCLAFSTPQPKSCTDVSP